MCLPDCTICSSPRCSDFCKQNNCPLITVAVLIPFIIMLAVGVSALKGKVKIPPKTAQYLTVIGGAPFVVGAALLAALLFAATSK